MSGVANHGSPHVLWCPPVDVCWFMIPMVCIDINAPNIKPRCWTYQLGYGVPPCTCYCLCPSLSSGSPSLSTPRNLGNGTSDLNSWALSTRQFQSFSQCSKNLGVDFYCSGIILYVYPCNYTGDFRRIWGIYIQQAVFFTLLNWNVRLFFCLRPPKQWKHVTKSGWSPIVDPEGKGKAKSTFSCPISSNFFDVYD